MNNDRSFPSWRDGAGGPQIPGSARAYCPLAPCIPTEFVQVGGYTSEQIRQSASFATEDAYLRHLERGHFIARVNAPRPFVLGREAAA